MHKAFSATPFLQTFPSTFCVNCFPNPGLFSRKIFIWRHLRNATKTVDGPPQKLRYPRLQVESIDVQEIAEEYVDPARVSIIDAAIAPHM